MPIKVPAVERGYDKPERAPANRDFGRALSDALRGEVAARKAERREAADPHGKIPTSTPIGIDPEAQEERRQRAEEARASMSDLIRGTWPRGRADGKTTSEILEAQARGRRV